jgi:hypothetical protein
VPEYHRAPARHEDATQILTGLLGYDSSRVGELAQGAAFGAGTGSGGADR